MTDHQTSFLSPLRHRVLQVDRRRYSVRLEDAYWAILEDIARKEGVRLASVIDEVATVAGADASLTAALRLRCLAFLRDRVAEEETGARAKVGTSGRYGASLDNLVAANPAPTLLLSHDGKILRANAAFQSWSGVKSEALTGQPYDWFFQLRLADSFQDTIHRLAHGTDGYLVARVSYIAPGRVVVANGLVCLGHYSGPSDFTWIVMIGAARGSAAAQTPPHAPAS